MATSTVLRSLRRRADLPSAYRSLTNNSTPMWSSTSSLSQSLIKSSRSFSTSSPGTLPTGNKPGAVQTVLAKWKAATSGDNSVKEIMADYVHHEVTRSFVMVSYSLFLTIVTKDVLVALALP